jgi:hypothetical protein
MRPLELNQVVTQHCATQSEHNTQPLIANHHAQQLVSTRVKQKLSIEFNTDKLQQHAITIQIITQEDNRTAANTWAI